MMADIVGGAVSPGDGRPTSHGSIPYNVQPSRLLATSAVVSSHAADRIVVRGSPIRSVPRTVGVDAFFVVSGFVMDYVAGDRFGTPVPNAGSSAAA